ncbi:hypothetical protein Cob_v004113 [Colletotrichum orbiculare MAFF 240422]|uniref:F-box domain-containing protein n=1 Tax=Colletotrichum orbiculare (strain 104-T / ATCC 96160 / CBS 514.97 / LARS 414 / MAFF 240422) TaxID=1213857 RepID=A0A484FYK5_COLOR|nr:hypothetical protein Cob_v004113 [Colletotrichum orbiculare MAFF 240422]
MNFHGPRIKGAKKRVAFPSEAFEETESCSNTKAVPFNPLFLGLPTELQIQVISLLPLTDVLNLRRVSKAWHAIITLNEAPVDIKRNAQVMLELIRDDGMDEEDEWWYGRSTPESREEEAMVLGCVGAFHDKSDFRLFLVDTLLEG